MSFSKERKIAIDFFRKKKDNFSRVLFIVDKDKDLDYSLATHADIENISYYQYEKEVLFFPFSSFEIKDIKEVNQNKYEYEIKLLYLGKYVKEIEKDKNIVEKGKEIPDSKLKEELIKEGLIQPEKINNINTKILFNKYLQYKKDIETKNNSFINKIEMFYKRYEKNQFKITLIGEESVGKTSIMKRYCCNSFNDSCLSTNVMDSRSKTISFKNENIILNIRDTPGHKKYRPLLYNYIKSSDAIILTYDLSDKSTFDNLSNFLSSLNACVNGGEKLWFLVGNKCECDIEFRKVSYNEGLSFAEKNNMTFHEVSAKTGKGIDKLFEDIIDKLITYYD